MWDHFGSQALRSTETLNAENKILKEIISRQRKKLLLLARQISQIESKSNSKNQTPEKPAIKILSPQKPVNEVSSPQNFIDLTSPIEMKSPKTLVTDVEEACSIVEVKVKNRDSDSTKVRDATNSYNDKQKKSLDTDVTKRKNTAKKRSSDEDLKAEQPSKKRRSSRKTNSNPVSEEPNPSAIPEKMNPTLLTKGSPPKIRRSSRTLRQKSPEIESKVPPKRNSANDKKEIKTDQKQFKELVCRWQKKDGTGNQQCTKTFGSMSAMQKHLQSHVPSWVSENASYICYWNGCKQNQKAFAGRMQLLTHFSKNHLL